MAATENHKSHNSKEENNNIGEEEEEPISLQMEKESNEEEPISVKIENEDDSKTLTIGKLKVKSFASLTNHQIAPSPIDYNQTGMMGPGEMQLDSTNLFSLPITRPFGFPRPIYNQQRFVANTSNFRPNNAFNPFLFQDNLPPHFPLTINHFGNQVMRAKQYVPLKIPSVNSSLSCQTRPSPSRPPLGINSDVKILNIDAERPLAPKEPCIRIPDFKAGSSNRSAEIIDVKPDINSLAEQIVKEEVDLDVHIDTILETEEVANMDIISENAEKLKQDVKLELKDCTRDDVYEEEEENGTELVRFDHKTAKHSCQGCFFSCNSSGAMKRHREKMHSSKSKFVCTVGCKDSTPYETFDHLVHHVATVHKGEKRWQCRKCGKSYKSRITYKKHLSPGKCKIVDPYACHECSFTCLTYSELERHQLKHRSKETQDEPVECPFCNRKLTKRRITAHINAHVENDKTFNCVQCNLFCKSLSRLKMHYKRTAHNRPYQCLNCKLRFITEEGLMNHDDKCPATRGLPPAYVCKFEGCTKRFNIESRYETHVKLHSLPEEDFIHCVEKKCDYKSTNRQSMSRHYAKTKHYRPFECPDCFLRFARESSLSYHIGRLHVAQILRKTNALRRTPSPVATTRIDENEVEVDSEQVAVANFQNGWLGISGFDPGEMTDVPVPDLRDCTTNEEAGDNFQYILPEVDCIVECQEEESKVTKSTENDSGSETETYIHENIKIEEMDESV